MMHYYRAAPALGSAVISPAALFANGEDGAFWNHQDAASVYQNSDGTVLSGIGDPIGYVKDLSGNGNHYIQATAASKPTRRQDALGRFYAEFDIVDDILSVPGTASAWKWLHDGTTDYTVILFLSAIAPINVPGNWYSYGPMTKANQGASTIGTAFFVDYRDDPIDLNWQIANGSAQVAAGGLLGFDDAAPDPMRAEMDTGASELRFYKDGSLEDTASTSGFAFSSADAYGDYVSCQNNRQSTKRDYGQIIINRLLTSREIVGLNAWAQQNLGVSI